VTSLRIDFDRGTLRLDGAAVPAFLDGAGVLYDGRSGFHRAPAHRYRQVVERAHARTVSCDDVVAREQLALPCAVAVPDLRPYQARAVDSFDDFGRQGIVVMPTGSGKTRVACAAMSRASCSTLVLVPTRALLEQWAAVLRTFYQGPIGIVGDGNVRLEAITVMTFESAYRRLDVWGHRFGMIVVDEVHHFGSGARSEALEMCTAPIRLGLTATAPHRGSEGEARLRDLVGPVVCEVAIGDLIGRHLADLEVVRIHVTLTEDERATYQRSLAPFDKLRRELRRTDGLMSFATCVQAIARMPGGRAIVAGMNRAIDVANFPTAKRRMVFRLLQEHRADRTLVFTAIGEHAYAVGADALVPVITAETGRVERASILDGFRDGRLRAICSPRVLNEGIDVPEANVAIIVAGLLGQREHVQRIGRILRPRAGKRATAYELVTLDTIDEALTRARRRPLAPPGPAVAHLP
jgi:superfamily II DNA or RNA helicase